MAKKIALFGAGKIGRAALNIMKYEEAYVVCFLDNDCGKWGTTIMGVPVMGVEEFIGKEANCPVLLTCSGKHRKAILEQLKIAGVKEVSVFDERKLWSGVNKVSILSYSHEKDLEDIVIYHALKGVEDIFYIDVGSNDPWMYSVTKLLYSGGGRGINIDPLPEMIEATELDRPRDINICAGVGAERGRMTLYRQGAFASGLSTVVESNRAEMTEGIEIDVLPLRDICKEHIEPGQEIHVLKIDVEGFEREVLLGADFSNYRPWIICIESTLPGTDIPCYENCEDIILAQRYVFASQFGVNRYYVAREHENLKERFVSRDELLKMYRIFHAELMMY